MLWNWRKILFLCTNPSNEVAITFALSKFSSIQVRGDKGRSRIDKSLSLGKLLHGPSSEIFKKSQASKLGDAKGIPFFIDNHRFLSWYYIFIPLHIMCCSWSVGLFLSFRLFLFCSLVFTINWIHACLFGREKRSAFSYTLLFFTYMCWVFSFCYFCF